MSDLPAYDTARLGFGAVPSYQAQLMVEGSPADDLHEVGLALTTIFPNMRFHGPQIAEIDADLGLWLVPLPLSVALLVEAGVEYGWTEAIVTDGHETLVSIVVSPS